MSVNNLQRILLIDDDAGNNTVSRIFLKRVVLETEIVAFTDPEKGLEYIVSEYTAKPVNTILLLDINMPVLSGWDVLDKFTDMVDDIKKYFTIFILTSSINVEDKQRAAAHPLVNAYIEKPMTIGLLKSIFLGD
jgi:CheY-like chemotaxis protein